ncbi:MAG: hypothetical protein IJ727_02765, partial [Treponema sp.]|nr:hypothetical protein [Treponema sp.]
MQINNTKNDFVYSLKTQTIVTTTILIMVAFVLTAFLLIRQQTTERNKHFHHIVELTADKKTVELDSCFSAIETSVTNAENQIMRTIDEERILKDPEYEESYMDFLTKEMSSLARLTKGVVAAYFRMNLEKYGGTRGIFIEGGSNKGFVSVKPTDLLQFSPNDMEHVGWYYIPLWKKQPVWTVPYENKNINIHMISYIVPMYWGEDFLGVVGMDINLAMLKDIVDTLPEDNMLAMLIGEDGNLVYYTNGYSAKKSVKQSAEISSILNVFNQAKEGDLSKFKWNYKNHYGVSRKLGNGMTLITAVSGRTITMARLEQGKSLLISFFIILVLYLFLLNLALKKIIFPIRVISRISFRLARGELGLEIPYKSKNELGNLAENIHM